VPARFLRENAFLVAAVALPLVVVGFFLLATAIPRWTVPPPAHDLLFTTSSYRQPRAAVSVGFRVVDGRLRADVRHALENTHPPRTMLWIFEHETLTTREVEFSVPELAAGDPPRVIDVGAVAGRRILTQPRAPDGYEVRKGDQSSPGIAGELFGMRRYDRRLSISKNGRVVSIDLPQQEWTTPSFVGWVVSDEAR